jgi:hypothetical protein
LIDPIDYYSPDTILFPKLAVRFGHIGHPTAEELYLILDWKASRARTKHLDRLTRSGRIFLQAAQDIAQDLHGAADDMERLRLLMAHPWRFPLPTATAVLTVLYPDRFRVYDIRVCEALGDFKKLVHWRWSDRFWPEYCRFVAAVRSAVPAHPTLRHADRYLWGMNKRNDLRDKLGLD